MVSCERTVRFGGGLVKFAGMIPNRGRVAALHCSYANRPPQISGRAQDTTRGGAWDRVLHKKDRKPDMLMANIQVLKTRIDFMACNDYKTVSNNTTNAAI